MVRCAVFGCNSDNQTKSKRPDNQNKEAISFFNFPTKNARLSNNWAKLCGRKDRFNQKNSRICSLHFKVTDFAHRYDLIANCKFKKKLKEGVYPSLNLPWPKSEEDKPLSERAKRLLKRNFENSNPSYSYPFVKVEMEPNNEQDTNYRISPETDPLAETMSVIDSKPIVHHPSPVDVPKFVILLVLKQ